MPVLRICKRPDCRAQGEPQPLEQFYVDRSRPDGLHPYCKTCHGGVIANFKEKQPEAYKASRKRATIKYQYGLDESEYLALLERAHQACEICCDSEARLGVDHDHVTGQVRGILCDSCN